MMILLHLPIPKRSLFLQKKTTYVISKRFYPLGGKDLGHALKVLNASRKIPALPIPPETTTSTIPSPTNKNISEKQPMTKPIIFETPQKLNPNKEIQKTTHQNDHIMTEAKKHQDLLPTQKTSSVSSESPVSTLKEAPFNITNVEKNLDQKESYTLSGLKDLPAEYFSGNVEFRTMYKKSFYITLMKIIHTMGYYKMDNPSALFKNFKHFFSSVVPTMHKTLDYKLFREVSLPKNMSDIQHLLVSAFKDKKFKRLEYSNEHLFNNIDMNMFKDMTILTFIECYVLTEILPELFDKYSFVMIDPQSPLLNEPGSVYGYDRKVSMEKIGQMHADGVGVHAICGLDGTTTLSLIYKDVKMYESGALNGRITLKPTLNYNGKAFDEYVSKVTSSIQTFMKNNNLEQDIIYRELLNNIKNIRAQFQKMNAPKNPIGDYIHKKDIEAVQVLLVKLNGLLIKHIKTQDPAIAINWGISTDPGKDEIFIHFFDKYFKEEEIKDFCDNKSEEDFAKLHSSKITPENVETLQKLCYEIASKFPEVLENDVNLKENTVKALDYIFNK